MRLLLVEDSGRLSEALAHILKKHGYIVETALDGETGFTLATTEAYDILVLDRMLPQRDGLDIVKTVRKLKIDTPILLLTAKDSTQDRIDGLDAGADDYLVKPFSTDELLARLRALARRQTKPWEEDTLEAANLLLDPLKCEVIKDNKLIKLTLKESLLLELLMRNYGIVISKERIWEKVWGLQTTSEVANVDLYIHYLRKKLETTCIKTVRGVGYYLINE
ncbi:Response regulator MprA [Sporomusa silvacetica DSM 10669]|uniref:Response regulator MprA n=1 Tax=Sporomusa silvacetica DSM 10669 TaxID=1123289 RepID=A0ABZ3IJU1_9FIRM|nr:response regulator transcription factor [Sporomusa silvacetica]OZC18859.1 response regulator MprA [Sporomusa silvacetica DSM 10669]